MDKKEIYAMAKIDMHKIINELNTENLERSQEHILDYFKFLHTLSPLLEDNTSSIHEQKTEDSLPENVYKMERKLKGGYLPELNEYVPETVVRKLNLEDGDFIRAELQKGEGASNNYYFTLIKKGDSTESNRSEVKYGVIEKDGDMLVIKKTSTSNVIKVNEAPFVFRVRLEDIQKLSLQENDIVDFAYNLDNPEFIKISWKYSTYNIIENEIKPLPKREKIISIDNHKEPGALLQMLVGKTVMVIGFEPRKSNYKDLIEEHGGEYLWADGTEGKSRLSSMISKSDAVIILIRFIKHQGSKDAIGICKQYDIPFVILESTLSPQTVVDKAAEAIITNSIQSSRSSHI